MHLSGNTTLSLATIGQALNLLGLAFPLALSLLLARSHPRPFFLWWTGSYAAYLGALLLFALHPPAWLGVAVLLLYQAGGEALLEVARQWRHPNVRPTWAWRQVGVASAGFLLLVTTGQLALGLTPAILLAVAAHLRLAWVIRRGPGTPSREGLSAAIAATGLWLLAFPFLAGSATAWFGFLVAGALHLLVGVGMVICLLEMVAAEVEAASAARAAFITTVAHEVRTPAAILKTGLWLLHHQRHQLPPVQQAEVIADLLASAERLEQLIGNVLSGARQEAGMDAFVLEVGPLERVVEAVRPLFERLADQRNVRLTFEADGSLPVAMDPEAMTRVLSNLLDNALRQTPSSGAVTVRLRREGARARLEVEDTGCGVPPGIQARIFERFYQGPQARAGGGVGLGLWLCKRLVEAHGGVIGLTSAPETSPGATFWVELPLAALQDAAAPAPASGPVQATQNPVAG